MGLGAYGAHGLVKVVGDNPKKLKVLEKKKRKKKREKLNETVVELGDSSSFPTDSWGNLVGIGKYTQNCSSYPPGSSSTFAYGHSNV